MIRFPLLFAGLFDRIFVDFGPLVFQDLLDPLGLILQSKSYRFFCGVHVGAVSHVSGQMYRVEFASRRAESAADAHVGIDCGRAALEAA